MKSPSSTSPELDMEGIENCSLCRLPKDACRRTCHLPPSMGAWLREDVAGRGGIDSCTPRPASHVTRTGDLPGEGV